MQDEDDSLEEQKIYAIEPCQVCGDKVEMIDGKAWWCKEGCSGNSKRIADHHKAWLASHTETLCNLCGLTCDLSEESSKFHQDGIVNLTVTGGYDSTPGNGNGCLDDDTVYTFSMCEWCLDWIFSKCKIPVMVTDHHTLSKEQYVPAMQRVIKDEWRKSKEDFFEEKERRDKARTTLNFGSIW